MSVASREPDRYSWRTQEWEERFEIAVTMAFAHGRAYERAVQAELKHLDKTWKTDLTEEGQRHSRAMKYGPGRTLVLDDPDWPTVTVPGGDQ